MHSIEFDDEMTQRDKLLVRDYFKSIGYKLAKRMYNKPTYETHKLMIIIDTSTEEETHVQLAEISYVIYTRRGDKVLKIKEIEYL